jgi:Resolvase, N terminal domain
MQVALYARVSTPNQQQEGTIASQVQGLKDYIHRHGWSLLPEHEYRDEGISGARLDRPALDQLRDAAQRGEFDAVVVWSPDRLARNYAHQWLFIEEFEKLHLQLICFICVHLSCRLPMAGTGAFSHHGLAFPAAELIQDGWPLTPVGVSPCMREQVCDLLPATLHLSARQVKGLGD